MNPKEPNTSSNTIKTLAKEAGCVDSRIVLVWDNVHSTFSPFTKKYHPKWSVPGAPSVIWSNFRSFSIFFVTSVSTIVDRMILRFCLTQTSSYNFSTDDDLHTPLHILPVQMSVICTWAKEIDTIHRNIGRQLRWLDWIFWRGIPPKFEH